MLIRTGFTKKMLLLNMTQVCVKLAKSKKMNLKETTLIELQEGTDLFTYFPVKIKKKNK